MDSIVEVDDDGAGSEAGPSRQLVDVDLIMRSKPRLPVKLTVTKYEEPFINKVSRIMGGCIGCCCCCCKGFIDIPDDYHGVVTEFGRYIRTLNPGTHKINPVTNICTIHADVFVHDDHMGVKMVAKIFTELLPPGQYFANPLKNEKIKVIPLTIINENHKGILTRNGIYIAPPLEPGKHFIREYLLEKLEIVPETIIPHGFVGLFLRNGRVNAKPLQPGKHFANPLLEETIKPIDMRVITRELVPQTILTSDTTNLTIKGILVYRRVDPIKSELEVVDIDHAIREQIKSISQQVLSEHNLDYIMTNKLELSKTVMERVQKNSMSWGVEVQCIDIKEISLPNDVKEDMSAAARAKRIAESMLIKADAEVKNAESMRKVADMLDSSAAKHMRETNALVDICTKSPNVKLLFVSPNLRGLMDERSMGQIIRNEVEKIDGATAALLGDH